MGEVNLLEAYRMAWRFMGIKQKRQILEALHYAGNHDEAFAILDDAKKDQQNQVQYIAKAKCRPSCRCSSGPLGHAASMRAFDATKRG